jgi:hypothetical protein
MFLCMDANFRLKNQLVSNYSQDPGLGIGWAYMVPRESYEAYVLSRADDVDVSSLSTVFPVRMLRDMQKSTCVGFQALAQANNRFSKGLRYTGVGGVFCGRSEMVMPMGIGNLQKGERCAFQTLVRLLTLLINILDMQIWTMCLHASSGTSCYPWSSSATTSPASGSSACSNA